MTPSLRIGVNALYLIPGEVGGTEIYLRELVAALARNPRGHEYFVFVNQETEDLIPAHSAFHAIQTGVPARSRPRRILYEQFQLPGAARTARIDVLLNAGFTSPHLFHERNVTIICDLQHHWHPEFFKPLDLLAWRLLVWASAKWSRRVLTISKASRDDIHTVYGVPLDRIDIAEPGADLDLRKVERSEDEPLVLFVSTLHPHKNHERLIDAFAVFRARHPKYRLVLAGMHGFHHEAVRQRIQHHRLGDAVTITGWIPRSEVVKLYAKARMAVFPSLFEGFGIPVLEAMTAGVPLITSDASPMRDTAGGAALLFPPTDTAALTAALERFANDPALRAEHAARGRERAALYTWDRTAAAALDSLERAVGKTW